LRQILLENGGTAIFITTPRGANHALKTLNLARREPGTWFSEVLTTKQTNVFSDQQLAGRVARIAVRLWLGGRRRSGKDDVSMHWACEAMLRRVGEYWHMLPEAAQAADC
jgi:hypothetical protein